MSAPRRLSFADYTAIDAVNWSTLKHLRVSPLHYQSALKVPRIDTAALVMGRATHTAVFEPDRLPLDYAVFTDVVDKRTKAGKETWAAFVKANAGKTILDVEEYERACAIRDAVRAHPLAAPLLTGGMPEAVLEWTDAMTGTRLKARLDWLGTGRVLGDLKTSRHAVDVQAFAADAFRLGYFHQLAFYARGVRSVTAQRATPTIIAVENAPPYDVAIYPVHPEALEAAGEEIDALLELLGRCIDTNTWPGKFTEPQLLNLPAWAYPSETEGMDFMKEAG